MATVSRKLIVDTTSGDVTTLEAGVAAAIAGGVSPASQWLLQLGLGTYSLTGGGAELDLPAGLSIEGQGTHRSTIAAAVTVRSGASLRDLRVLPPFDTVAYGVRCVLDPAYNTYTIQLDGVNVTVQHSTLAGVLSAVEFTGASNGAFIYIMPGCYFYTANRYTGDNTSGAAKGVVFRMKSDFRTYVEGWGVHAKTSSAGTALQVLRLVECNPTPSSTDFGYIELRDTLWNNVHGGDGGQPEGYSVMSVNTNWPGDSSSHVSYWSRGGGRPLVQSAYTGTIPARTQHEVQGIVSRGPVSRLDGGSTFDVPAATRLNHVPTGADAAPDGTVAFVV